MRYTKKFIEARFAMAMDAIGAPHGEAYTKQDDGRFKANVGTHQLDHNSVYGGYVITKIVNEGGGESCPFGMNRHNAEGFIALLDGVLGAAEYLGRASHHPAVMRRGQ